MYFFNIFMDVKNERAFNFEKKPSKKQDISEFSIEIFVVSILKNWFSEGI